MLISYGPHFYISKERKTNVAYSELSREAPSYFSVLKMPDEGQFVLYEELGFQI